MNEFQLIEAAKAGDINRARLFIDGGGDAGQKDAHGWTALNWAAGRGDLAMVRLLLDAGADPANGGRDGRTPYQIALAAAWVEVATVLREAERRRGLAPESAVRPYCKAYPAKAFERFPGWKPTPADDAVLYLHQDLSVTESIWHGENVVFDGVSEDWRRYCRDSLGFDAPSDLALAADYHAMRSAA